MQTHMPRWQSLPATPSLPRDGTPGQLSVGDCSVWHATFGSGEPVLLLHGGLANSDYFGLLVSALSRQYKVIVMDSRGHGRSGFIGQMIGYDRMAADVVSLLDHLGINCTSVVGWSDGAVVGLSLAASHPSRVLRLFAFAANSSPVSVKDPVGSATFIEYIARVEKEFLATSPTPGAYQEFRMAVEHMWETEPCLTRPILRKIGAPVWIVDGDKDEVIGLEDQYYLSDTISNAGLLIQPWVSHFSLLQDNEQFTGDVLRFLSATWGAANATTAA